MMQDFLSTWPLFRNTYLVGWFIAVLLSLNGFLVVSRQQIFYGAAVSQASAMGVALGLFLAGFSPFYQSDAVLSLFSIAFSLLASIFMNFHRGAGKGGEEEVSGWIFLLAASLSILLVSHSPHGLEEVHRLQASSILGVQKRDLWIFSALLVVTLFMLCRFHSRLLLYAMDREMAASVGLNVRKWSFWSAIWLGLVIGLCIRASGMLYTFGCLVLPGLAAKRFSRELWQYFLIAPLVALILSMMGFILANHYDFPPGPATIGLFALFAGLGYLR